MLPSIVASDALVQVLCATALTLGVASLRGPLLALCAARAAAAVELLLADCYVRRDRAAVLAFRGKAAELLLPPTRSLVHAKRSLAGLPGGGTPLAAGMDAARALALACGRRGETPIIVLLTDGRANIARDGSAGRERATLDALAAARTLRAASLTALLLDTSPQAQPGARRLAQEMGLAEQGEPERNPVLWLLHGACRTHTDADLGPDARSGDRPLGWCRHNAAYVPGWPDHALGRARPQRCPAAARGYGRPVFLSRGQTHGGSAVCAQAVCLARGRPLGA